LLGFSRRSSDAFSHPAPVAAVVIYDSNGQELKRFQDLVGPEPFLAAIEAVQ
jgi:hypothetical protein